MTDSVATYCVHATEGAQPGNDAHRQIATCATLNAARRTALEIYGAKPFTPPIDFIADNIWIQCPGFSPLTADIRPLIVLRGDVYNHPDTINRARDAGTLPNIYRRGSHTGPIYVDNVPCTTHLIVQRLPTAWRMSIEYVAAYIPEHGDIKRPIRHGDITARVRVMHPSANVPDNGDWNHINVIHANQYNHHQIRLRGGTETISLRRQIIALLDSHPALTAEESAACIADVDSVFSTDITDILPKTYTID